MKLNRANLLIEPPSSAASDIAFILIVFFLVCASVQPESGRPQQVPRAETKQDKSQQSQNIEIAVTRSGVMVNGSPTEVRQLETRLRSMLAEKTRPQDKVVVVNSKEDVPYHHWIDVTGRIDKAGGVITLQLEEQREVVVE